MERDAGVAYPETTWAGVSRVPTLVLNLIQEILSRSVPDPIV